MKSIAVIICLSLTACSNPGKTAYPKPLLKRYDAGKVWYAVEGNGLKGEVLTKEKTGIGTLIKGSDTFSVTVEWNGYGEMEALDSLGRTFQIWVAEYYDERPGGDSN